LRTEGKGERTEITQGKSGQRKTVARDRDIEKAFEAIDRIRKRAKPLPKGMTVKDLIEEGRR